MSSPKEKASVVNVSSGDGGVIAALDIALAPNVLARLIADNLGFPIDQALRDKSEWNALRGEKGGRYHDINEPFQTDYLDAGRAVAEYIRAAIQSATRTA